MQSASALHRRLIGAPALRGETGTRILADNDIAAANASGAPT